MNEGNGTTANDSSGNGASGTMVSPYTANWVADNTFNFSATTIPKIERTQISVDNSTVSVTFSSSIFGGSANATSTLEVADFALTISGGSASLSSATPSSISVSGTTIGLGISLSGTPDGNELLTILPASNSSIFSVSGNTVSTTQSSNTTELIPNIITNNLLLYLDSRNKSSYPEYGSIWYDLSGNNYNGNLQNTTSFSSDYNGILNFNGSTDWVELNSFSGALTNSSSYTILLHFKSTETNASGNVYNNAIFSMHNSGTNIFRLGAAPDGNKGLYYNIGSADSRAGSNINLHNNEWRFAVISKDVGSNANFYIDNQLVSAGASPGNTTNFNSVNQVSIGQEYDNSTKTDHFQGSIPVVMVYNKALTANEINQIYDALIDIPPSDISLSSNTISETSTIGSLIGTFSATDSDTSSNNLTFSFTSSGDAQDDDNGSFTISGNSLLTSTTLDYETKTSYNIYVNVSDGNSNYAKAFTISVNDVVGLTDDIILHLDANNSNSYSGSGSNWLDLSGSNNHATFYGNTSYSASDGGHIYFDGNGDRLNFASAINIPVVGWTMTMIIDIPTQNQSWWNYFLMQTGGGYKYEFGKYGTSGDSFSWKDNNRVAGTNLGVNLLTSGYSILSFGITDDGKSFYSLNGSEKVLNTASNTDWSGRPNLNFNKLFGGFSNSGTHNLAARVKKIMLHTRELSNAELFSNYVSIDNEPPYITATRMELDNSKVNVIFSDHMSSTLQPSDFSLSLNGGSATLASQTPTSVTVSGTKVSLGVNLIGTPNGDELITVSVQPNSVYDYANNVASSTQSNNSANLIRSIVHDDVIAYLDARNIASYPGNGTSWYDLSGNDNDFRLYGATYNNSGYFDFDGTNDWARTISSLDLSSYSAVTVQINFKSENTNSTEATYEHSTNWNTQTGGFGLFAHSAGGPFVNNTHHTNQNGGFSGNSGRNYQFNINTNWHLHTNIHSMVNDATGRLSYVDDTLIPFSSSPYPNSTVTINGSFSDHYFYIGSRAGTNYYFNGQVESIIIYGSKLSANQVSNNYYALTDANRNPTDISLSSSSVNENVSLGTAVGNLSTTDADNWDTHSYSLVAGAGDTDNASFSISGSNLVTASALDFETKNVYSVRIRTNDGTATYTESFTISVLDLDEDDDNDGIANTSDNCPTVANPDQADNDQDGVGNVCDNCVDRNNPFQVDTDADGYGDVCDEFPMMLLKTPILMVTVLGIMPIPMMIMITGQIRLNWPVELVLQIAR